MEKIDKCLYLARNVWNMMVTVITIVIGAPGKVLKGLERRVEKLEIGGRIVSALFRVARILRRFRSLGIQ